MPEPSAPDPSSALLRVVQEERRAVLAALVRHVGDLGLAEDALQDATVQALGAWPNQGVPPNPRAWLLTAARHRAIDRVRRESRRTNREHEASLLQQIPPAQSASAISDDVLRLIFTCCHPALSPEAQMALSLRTLCGLSTAEVARALLVSESTMTRRLTRARQKIALAKIPYRVPADHELPTRMNGVAATVYLLFNEGYGATSGADHLRPDVAGEAIRLGRLLVDLLPGEPSLLGLLALMLLQHARAAARIDRLGNLVLLADQDRSLWHRDAIDEGIVLVADGLRRSPDRPNPYVVQAAIAACHALAASAAETDWLAILSWYDVLLTVLDNPVVRLNRAVAVAEVDGPGAALVLVDGIAGLGAYAMWHATRAELSSRLGLHEAATAAFGAAAALPLNDTQRRHIEARLHASRTA